MCRACSTAGLWKSPTDPGDGNRSPNGEGVRGDRKEALGKVPASEQEPRTRPPHLSEEGERPEARTLRPFDTGEPVPGYADLQRPHHGERRAVGGGSVDHASGQAFRLAGRFQPADGGRPAGTCYPQSPLSTRDSPFAWRAIQASWRRSGRSCRRTALPNRCSTRHALPATWRAPTSRCGTSISPAKSHGRLTSSTAAADLNSEPARGIQVPLPARHSAT